MNIYKAKILDWSWIHDYGLIKNETTGKELFLHHSNVRIKAIDKKGDLIKLKMNDDGTPAVNDDSFVRDTSGGGKQIYGRSDPPKGFLDECGNEMVIKPYGIWFDIGESVYYTIDNNYPNVAFNVTLSKKETLQAYKESMKKTYTFKNKNTSTWSNSTDFNATDSDDDVDTVNPKLSTPVRTKPRVRIPPSPGELLTPVKSPKRKKQIKPNIFKTPVKKQRSVGIPPSPGDF